MNRQMKETLAKFREQFKTVDVEVITYTNTSLTLADVLAQLNTINTNKHHVFFDTSAFHVSLYLCTIFIDVDNDKVRIADLVTGKKYVGSYEASKTLYACMQEAVDDICTIYVDCLAPEGDNTTLVGIDVQVTDQKDLVIATKTYNGHAVAFPLPIYQQYKVKLLTDTVNVGGTQYFAPEVESGNIIGTITEDSEVVYRFSSTEHITSLSAIKTFLALEGIDTATKRSALVRGENNSFSVNIQIKKPETNVYYTMPVYVLAVDTYKKLVNGVEQEFLGARCSFGYALPDSYIWDEREQEITTDGETFQSGIYYFTATSSGIGDKSFTRLTEGTDYQVGDDIDTYESTNNVYVYKHAWNDSNVVRYGNNVYSESNIDKWLNASGDNWFVPSHIGDILANMYKTKKGFKDWFKSSDLSQIEDNVAYGVHERSGHEDTNNTIYRQFVLLSGTEMAGSVNANEGTVFDYWKYLNGGNISNSVNANRTMCSITNTSSKVWGWTRSPGRGYSRNAWRLAAGGNLDSYDVYGSNAALPLFTI